MARLLNEFQQAYLQDWVDTAKPMLGLTDWETTIKARASTNHECLAEIFIGEQSRAASIRVTKDFLKADPFRRTQILLHELMHLTISPLVTFIGNHSETDDDELISVEAEKACDALARALAPLFPEITFE